MIVGCLGDILFEVSAETVRTVSNFTWSGSARYASHQLVEGDTLSEFTGRGTDRIKFDIVLSAYLGVSPMEEISRLFEYQRTGRILALVLGSHGYGRDKWTITELEIKTETFDGEGDITHAVISLSLQEYLRN